MLAHILGPPQWRAQRQATFGPLPHTHLRLAGWLARTSAQPQALFGHCLAQKGARAQLVAAGQQRAGGAILPHSKANFVPLCLYQSDQTDTRSTGRPKLRLCRCVELMFSLRSCVCVFDCYAIWRSLIGNKQPVEHSLTWRRPIGFESTAQNSIQLNSILLPPMQSNTIQFNSIQCLAALAWRPTKQITEDKLSANCVVEKRDLHLSELSRASGHLGAASSLLLLLAAAAALERRQCTAANERTNTHNGAQRQPMPLRLELI